MTIDDRFSPAGRRVLARAGALAAEDGGRALDDGALLAALAGEPSVAGRLGVPVEAVRPGGRDRELLAALGIDLDRVRDRARLAIGHRVDDPARWRLRRPRLLPLRLCLAGPAADLVLTEPARKAVEVAVHGARAGEPAGELDLLRGLLADGRAPAVRVLARLGVDLCRLARTVLPGAR